MTRVGFCMGNFPKKILYLGYPEKITISGHLGQENFQQCFLCFFDLKPSVFEWTILEFNGGGEVKRYEGPCEKIRFVT